jgi:hypothetical protein
LFYYCAIFTRFTYAWQIRLANAVFPDERTRFAFSFLDKLAHLVVLL